MGDLPAFVRRDAGGEWAIVGESRGEIRSLVGRAKPAQNALLAIAREDPARTLAEVRRLEMPMHHDVRQADVNQRRLGAVLALAHERDVSDFASVLLLEQLGPRTLQSLALVAEVVHGPSARVTDPARFAFAHGGKDGSFPRRQRHLAGPSQLHLFPPR